MEINLSKQPAIASAPFGMSACGHAFELNLGLSSALTTGLAATTVVRDRQVGVEQATKGDMGFATAYIPGTSAWRPPSS